MPFHGERLKETRDMKGLTQRELASIAGMNEVQLSRYENSKMEPAISTLENLARKLEVSTDYLLGLTNDPRKHYGDTEISEEERAIIETYRKEGWAGVARLGVQRLAQ